MLKDFVVMLKERQEKEQKLIEKCVEEYKRRVSFNKEIAAEYKSISSDAPAGFDSDDPIL